MAAAPRVASKKKPSAPKPQEPTPRELKIKQYEKALERLKTKSGMEGTPWLNGMIRHYTKLIDQLKSQGG